MSIEDLFYFILPSYKKLPDWAKKALTSPFRLFPRSFYLGKYYHDYFKLAEIFEFATKAEIDEFQWLQLKQIILDAYNYVPFYRKRWTESGIDPFAIKDIDDFKKNIPTIERKDVQAAPDLFVSEKYSQNQRLKVTTSGSSGIPLTLYYLKGLSRSAEIAHMHAQWSRSGFKVGGRIGRLRGDYLGKGRNHTFDPWQNTLLLSSFALNKATASEYLKLMQIHSVEYLHVYPSSLFNLLQLSEEKTHPIGSLKAIYSGSENITDWQIERFKEFFQINNIFHWYGHAELCALGGVCEKSSAYHFMPTYSHVEFLNSDASHTKNSSDVKEIIGTSFINPVMPLIRYRTADFAIKSDAPCICGREHIMASKVVGREQEMAIGKNGEKITLTALIHARHARYFHHLVKMQILNTSPGTLIVKVVPKAGFNQGDKDEIVQTLSAQQGMPFNASVEIVDEIQATERGKHRLLIRTFKDSGIGE